MFRLNETYDVHRKILKCDYVRYSPAETSTIHNPKSQISIKIPREDSVISLLKSYLELNFEVIKRGDISRYANGIDIRSVNLGPIALFSNFKLTTSSGNHLEDINHAHIASQMYKPLTSSKSSVDLSIGFDRDHGRRRDELSNNENIKGIYHLRIMLKGVFVFAKCQEEATYGLSYKLTLPRKKTVLL